MIKIIIANNMWQTFKHNVLSDSNKKTNTSSIKSLNINNYKKLYVNNVIINHPMKYNIKNLKK